MIDLEAAIKHLEYLRGITLPPGAMAEVIDAALGDGPRYRIPTSVVHTHDEEHVLAAAMCLRCLLDMHIADGELVQLCAEKGCLEWQTEHDKAI